jgi:septum formation topological specificity factor MinE
METQFKKIKALYESRDLKAIEVFVEELYQNQELPVLIGTSNGELCYQKEDIIKIFKSDLEGWGDVDVDLDSLELIEYGPYQVGRCFSTIKQTFNLDDQTYDRFVHIVESIKKSDEGTNYQKITLIQRLLVHLMHDRKKENREYLWDMYLDMIAKQGVCLALQFSLPIDPLCPDVRIDDFETYNKSLFERELEIIQKMKAKSSISIDFKDQLKSIVIKDQKADSVALNDDIVVIDQSDEYFCFVAVGSYQKKVKFEERLSLLLKHEYQGMESKRALYALRRDIASHLAHDAIGETMDVHFRMTGIGIINNQGVDILYHQITLPFNLILEEKTDRAKALF